MSAEHRGMLICLTVLAVGFAGMTIALPGAAIAAWQWVAEVPRGVWGAITEVVS